MRKTLLTFSLGLSLIGPLVLRADDDHRRRYYDREHRDYHHWNAEENRAYNHFLQERHRDHHDWERAKREEQREYWKWRHEHPRNDWDRDRR